MGRIKLVRAEEAEDRVKEIFREIEQMRGQGRLPNLMRALGNHPRILEANWERTKQLMKSGLLSVKLKDAIGLTMAAVYKCQY